MPPKKRSTKTKPTKKPKAAARKAKKPIKKPPKRARKAASSKKSKAPKPRRALVGKAKRLATFSEQVLQEEDAPIAVRTFNEARAGIEQSKVLDIKSGSVSPAPTPMKSGAPSKPTKEEPDVEFTEVFDEEEPVPSPQPASRAPAIRPLTGDLAVPKRPNPMEEEFRIGPAAKKGKKGAPPTKDEFGKIELRMQRGSKDETIARANPDYLQRSFNKAAQKGKTAASPSRGEDESNIPEFQVEMDKAQPRVDTTLSDFGDVEIAQQTRRGSKKVGTLETDEEKDA